MSRTPSITETLLGKTTNIRNNPDAISAASQNVTVRTPYVPASGPGTVRSNVNPQGAPRVTIPIAADTPVLQDVVPGTQKAGFNWLVGLLILGGGFFAMKKFKKKKNV